LIALLPCNYFIFTSVVNYHEEYLIGILYALLAQYGTHPIFVPARIAQGVGHSFSVDYKGVKNTCAV
jgi:hypothetical protein